MRYWKEHMEERTNIELIYSTPSMYVDAVNAQKIVWPTKYDDMFPYADYDAAYWTGFYTSRANDKKYMRDASHTLHSSNKLFALAGLNQQTNDTEIVNMISATSKMTDVVGVIQHHDSITGTGKQHVANDYSKKIYEAIEMTNEQYAEVISKMARNVGVDSAQWSWCQR
jgi:lysosomal alpha-mannosidase